MARSDLDSPESLFQDGAQLAQRAQRAIDALRAQRAEIDGDIKRLNAFVRNLGVSRNAVPNGRLGKSASKKSVVTQRPETLLRIAEAALAMKDETFSLQDLARLTGDRSLDTPRRAMQQLREMQFLAAAGRAHPPGKKMGQPRQMFRVMDRHIIDQLRSKANAA